MSKTKVKKVLMQDQNKKKNHQLRHKVVMGVNSASMMPSSSQATLTGRDEDAVEEGD